MRDEFGSKLQKHNVFCHFHPSGCTDLLQAGVGSAVKTYMNQFYEDWLSHKTGGISNIVWVGNSVGNSAVVGNSDVW